MRFLRIENGQNRCILHHIPVAYLPLSVNVSVAVRIIAYIRLLIYRFKQMQIKMYKRRNKMKYPFSAFLSFCLPHCLCFPAFRRFYTPCGPWFPAGIGCRPFPDRMLLPCIPGSLFIREYAEFVRITSCKRLLLLQLMKTFRLPFCRHSPGT